MVSKLTKMEFLSKRLSATNAKDLKSITKDCPVANAKDRESWLQKS
jgi:hypothetical protein